jgi:hypothetical protein
MLHRSETNRNVALVYMTNATSDIQTDVASVCLTEVAPGLSRLCQQQPRWHWPTPGLSQTRPRLCRAHPRLHWATLVEVRQCWYKTAASVIVSTNASPEAVITLALADVGSTGRCTGCHPVNTTLPRHSVGGTPSGITSLMSPLKWDSGNVISNNANVISTQGYIGCLDRCNIGLSCPM